MADTEAMARAMYYAMHNLADRPRNWEMAPDEDIGAELGRNTLRAMAVAAGEVMEAPAAREVKPRWLGAMDTPADVEPKGVGGGAYTAEVGAVANARDEV